MFGLQKHTKSNMIKQLFSDLESRNEKKIKAALQQLENEPALKQQAEQRYLKLIQARLNTPEATLADIYAASPSKEEVDLIRERLSSDESLSFEGLMEDNLSQSESKAFVDLVGGVIASCLDIEAHLTQAKSIDNYKDLKIFLDNNNYGLKAPLKEQIDLSSNSRWFAKIARKIYSAKTFKTIYFNHTVFVYANQSLVLKEFMYFILGYREKHPHTPSNAFLAGYETIYIDIAQSTTINLTEVAWILPLKYHINLLDSTIELPDNPLSLGRKKWDLFRISNESAWAFSQNDHFFLSRVTKSELEKILTLLESRKAEKVEKALRALEENIDFKKIAEQRYLPLIKARLNKPNATLADILEASPSPEEVRLVKKIKYLNPEKYTLNLTNLSAKESKAFVDLIGGIIAGSIDINNYIEAVKSTKNQEELNNLLWRRDEDGYGNTLQLSLLRQQDLNPKGWFGQIIQKLLSTNNYNVFYNLDFIHFELDREAAEAFNNSIVLPAFMYYIYRSTYNNGFEINIRQDVFPNLTNLFWVFGSVPTIKIHDQSIDIKKQLPPNNLLNYSREIPDIVVPNDSNNNSSTPTNNKTPNMIKQLFSDLESRNEQKINAALQVLENEPVLKQQAEQRYLKLIQARLNNPKATLADIHAASPSDEEVDLVKKVLSSGNCYDFEYLDESNSKAVVDLVGGIVASCLDMDAYITKAKSITSYDQLWEFYEAQFQMLKNALKDPIDLSSNSRWFAKIAKKVRAAKRCYQWRFDHTNFETANKSLVLKEFIYFLFEKKHKDDLDSWASSIEIDVFQSTPPNLTEAIWLLIYRTNFVIKNTTQVAISPSPLSLELNQNVHFKIEADISDFNHGPYYTAYNEELVKILLKLESRNEQKINKALEELEWNVHYKRIAERRYLPLIRLRLNNPEATLADMYAASPSKKEVNLITSKKFLDIENYTLNLKLASPEDCKTFINLIGGVIAGCVDINKYIQVAKTTKNTTELNALLWTKESSGYGDELSVHLNRHYRLVQTSKYSQPKGWFTDIVKKLSSTNKGSLFHNLDFINFQLKDEVAKAFNEAEMLPEFMYYIYRSTYNNGFEINIKQNIFPNLTNLFWIFGAIPTIKVHDQAINIVEQLPPNDLLNYSREVPNVQLPA